MSCDDGTSADDSASSETDTMMTTQPMMATPTGGDSVSDAMIQKFLMVDQLLIPLQQVGQDSMFAVLEEEGMPLQQYQQVSAMMKQGGQGVAEEDIKKYQAINVRIQEVNNAMRLEAEKIMTDAGYSMEQYQAIVGKAQQNPELMKRIEQISSSMKEQNQPQGGGMQQ